MGARPLPLTALAAATAVLACPPAFAQGDPRPVPGCAGEAFTDPRGDRVEEPLSFGLNRRAADNSDITGGFFRSDGGVVTANIRLVDLSTRLAPFATGIGWFMHYVVGDVLRFVAAETDGGEVAFSHGILDPARGMLITSGPTRGRLFPGPDGIVQIEIPAAAGGVEGTTLGAPFAQVDVRTSLIARPTDQAPDDLRGTSYTVGGCGNARTPAARALLPLRAPSLIGSARRANLAGALEFRVRSERPISSLRFVLRARHGSHRAFAAGRLAALDGAATLRMRLLRPLRRGRYVLRATGTVAGARASYARQVILRR